jgi:hypothetical protein
MKNLNGDNSSMLKLFILIVFPIFCINFIAKLLNYHLQRTGTGTAKVFYQYWSVSGIGRETLKEHKIFTRIEWIYIRKSLVIFWYITYREINTAMSQIRLYEYMFQMWRIDP